MGGFVSLPVVHLKGAPYEQGLQHGKELRDRIAHNLAVYFTRFEREAKLPRVEVLWRAREYREVIRSEYKDYFDALLGVVDGAEFELDEIVALNVRYELLYYQFGVNAMAGGCTAFAVLPSASANGHLLLGQNWDWIPQAQGAVLRTVESDGLETLAFTEAGIVGGKIGLNSAGLGLCINGMTTTDDDWSRLSKPFHVRCYEILRSRDLDAAVQVVTDEPRACSTNFLMAQIPDRVVDIEAAPNVMNLLGCENGCLVHANHFTDPDVLGVVEPPYEMRPHSCHRMERLRWLLQSGFPVGIADVQRCLRDHDGHPHSVCRHEDPTDPEEEHYLTVTSVVIDLHDRIVHLTDGPPCQSAYQVISLGG
jgi:isopenicillin-N N-acyltransferase-like protein